MLEAADTKVARRTQKAANAFGVVAMINVQPFVLGGGSANRAAPALSREHLVVCPVRQPEVVFELAVGDPDAMASLPVCGVSFVSLGISLASALFLFAMLLGVKLSIFSGSGGVARFTRVAKSVWLVLVFREMRDRLLDFALATNLRVHA